MGTTGLLLLTDDGEFAQRIAHPSYEVEKTYMATVRGIPSERILDKARKGVQIEGQQLRVRTVELLRAHRKGAHRKKAVVTGESKEKARLRVVLVEGKNREVRRLFQALGHPVLELHRSKIGSLSDRGLPEGAYRSLTPREIRRFAPPDTVPRDRKRRRPRRNEGRAR
jgi:23S rRNA pseudouridine2605 synthase